MNRQAGVIAPIWLYGMGALLLIAAVAGLVREWGVYTEALERRGYDRGVAITDAAYKARDNAQLQAVIARMKTAEAQVAAVGAARDAALELAKSNYTKGVQDGKVKGNVAVAAIRAGTLRLRDPGAPQTGISAACGGGIAAASPLVAGPVADGYDGRGGLSGEGSEFLVSEATRANAIVKKLNLCRARVVSDLQVCGAGP